MALTFDLHDFLPSWVASSLAGIARATARAAAIIPRMRDYVNTLLRLWTLRRVSATSLPLYPSVLLLALWCAGWVGYDWWEARPDPRFFPDGIPLLAWYGLAAVLLAAFLQWRTRPTPAFSLTLSLVVGLIPIPMLITTLAASYLSQVGLWIAELLAAGYLLLYLARGLRSFTGHAQRLTALSAFALVVLFALLSDVLDVVPDVWDPVEIEAPVASTDSTLADEEQLLFEQSGKIDRALESFPKDAAAVARGYFLGFAGVGDERVFAQEIDLAGRVIGERYAIGARSLALINDARDLERAPLASVTGLTYALRGLAARMDVERDVLFLAIASHGAPDQAIVVTNSELPLNDLTDQGLADALRQSGIRWKVIVISACYSGAFIEALKDPRTIVIAASAADRTSFGCGAASDLTYFGQAFYRDALPHARSLHEAFDQAKAAIALRERREHVDASRPQAYFGAELEAKLKTMEPRD
jgi:hypothetical protein